MPYPTIKKHWNNVEYNDAEHLGVGIARTLEPGWHVRCMAVHLLTKAENGNNHNVYFDVIDTNNQRIKLSEIRGINNNIKLRAILDKPDHEMGTNFALHAQDTVSAWVTYIPVMGLIPSDVVTGLHSRWGGDMVGGQDYGHISYYVIFQLVEGAALPPPPPPPPPPDPNISNYAKGFIAGFEAAKAKVIEALSG